MDGDDVVDVNDDQVTTYTYGVTKGVSAGDSKIGSGHLLQKVQYPDSSGGTDVVSYAYNAQRQLIWFKDQSGNITETDFDTGGRETDRKITTLDADFDGAVRRITMAFDTQGRVDTVTQYDAATAGNVVDQVQYTYDDWGNMTTFAMDRNSVITGGTDASDGYYDVDYAFAKSAPSSGRQTIRTTSMTWPNAATADYNYLSLTDLFDDDVSRVSRIQVSGTTVASYAYNGVGDVVKINYPQPDVFNQQHGSSMGDYPDRDRFNRPTSSRWTKDLGTDVDFFDCDIAYDRNSGITLIEDNVHVGFDVEYTNDDLGRLTQTDEGTWSGSAITSQTREQIWTLDQVGNSDVVKLDLDGDANYNETDEYNDDRTHNLFNELTGRDTDDNGSDDYTLVYDEVGNLTDDGENYEYVYDAFGRLRKINNTSDQSLVAEYWYNGLGFLITVHEDTDVDGDVDVNDIKYHRVYNNRWQQVAVYRADDDNPKELFLYHQAGLDGSGGSSYIDAVVLRQKDDNSGWTNAADGTLEQRYYYCQNWRSDVVAIVTSAGKMMEWVKYSAYGVPYGLPAGDTDSNAVTNQTDVDNIDAGPAYDVRYDANLDGSITAADSSRVSTNFLGVSLGWDGLTNSAVGNRKGYAGYEFDEAVSKYHVRNRVLDSHLGRWTRRDPLGYLDGMNVYEYVSSHPSESLDPSGHDGDEPVKTWSIWSVWHPWGTSGHAEKGNIYKFSRKKKGVHKHRVLGKQKDWTHVYADQIRDYNDGGLPPWPDNEWEEDGGFNVPLGSSSKSFEGSPEYTWLYETWDWINMKRIDHHGNEGHTWTVDVECVDADGNPVTSGGVPRITDLEVESSIWSLGGKINYAYKFREIPGNPVRVRYSVLVWPHQTITGGTIGGKIGGGVGEKGGPNLGLFVDFSANWVVPKLGHIKHSTDFSFGCLTDRK